MIVMQLDINLQQRTILGISTGLALIALITFFYCLWQWYSDWTLTHQTIKSSQLESRDASTSNLISHIPDAHLFGQSTHGDVPISSLQLRVTGIVKADDEQGDTISKAYISISGEPSKIFQVNDNLPFGVKIHEITADAVILIHDGKLEKLPLPREKLEFKPRTEDEANAS